MQIKMLVCAHGQRFDHTNVQWHFLNCRNIYVLSLSEAALRIDLFGRIYEDDCFHKYHAQDGAIDCIVMGEHDAVDSVVLTAECFSAQTPGN